MKVISNYTWKLLAAVALALALTLPMVGSAVAATGDTKVTIPAEVVGVDSMGSNTYGPVVYFRQGSTDYGPFNSGEIAPLNAGTYSWKFRVNGYTGPLRTGFVANGTNELVVTAADYCNMAVVIPAEVVNLDGSPAYITDRWLPDTYKFFNNDSYYLPMGTTDAYWLTINGKSTLHNKFVDCSDLVVTGADYCKMGVQLPQVLKDANATVRIYGISQTFTGGETVVLPMGQVITWYLKINGKEVAHTGKPVDCTPVNVTAADYCNVLNNSGASIDISGYGSVAAGNSVLFPTGIQIEWKPSTQHAWPGTKKAVDCTPLVSAPPVNQPPQAVDDTYNTSEDTALVIAPPGVLGNDNDPDGNPITAVKVSDPAHGALTINSDGSFTYTPAGNYNGPDSFTYKANDGTDDSNVATVTITVNMANDPPVANAGPDQADIEQTSYADAEVTLDGSGSSDPDGDTLTYEWTWASGTASGVNPTATFPLGSTTVTLTVSDGELSATDTVDIAVVDTTPPVVDITSPDDDKTYLNTEGPIPVEYTATDICDSSLTITMTLDGNLFTGDKINLCGMASGEHTLVVSAADDSGNTGTDSATFNVVPQSLKTFTIKHMLIQWSRPGIWARFDKDTFTLSGRLQLPAGCTVEDLNKSATLTIAISDASGTDTVLCKVRPLNKAGIIWKYNGKEQPPGEGMNIHNLIIWWTPQSGKWAGWAGFHISGVLQLPEEIGVNTQPAEATITIEMPAKTESGCGSLIAKNTVKFKVLGSARLWLYNVWPNLSAFPCEPTGTE